MKACYCLHPSITYSFCFMLDCKTVICWSSWIWSDVKPTQGEVLSEIELSHFAVTLWLLTAIPHQTKPTAQVKRGHHQSLADGLNKHISFPLQLPSFVFTYKHTHMHMNLTLHLQQWAVLCAQQQLAEGRLRSATSGVVTLKMRAGSTRGPSGDIAKSDENLKMAHMAPKWDLSWLWHDCSLGGLRLTVNQPMKSFTMPLVGD